MKETIRSSFDPWESSFNTSKTLFGYWSYCRLKEQPGHNPTSMTSITTAFLKVSNIHPLLILQAYFCLWKDLPTLIGKVEPKAPSRSVYQNQNMDQKNSPLTIILSSICYLTVQRKRWNWHCYYWLPSLYNTLNVWQPLTYNMQNQLQMTT